LDPRLTETASYHGNPEVPEESFFFFLPSRRQREHAIEEQEKKIFPDIPCFRGTRF